MKHCIIIASIKNEEILTGNGRCKETAKESNRLEFTVCLKKSVSSVK